MTYALQREENLLKQCLPVRFVWNGRGVALRTDVLG